MTLTNGQTTPNLKNGKKNKNPPKRICAMGKEKCIERKFDKSKGDVVSKWCSECHKHLHELCFIPFHIAHDPQCPYGYKCN